MQLENFKQMLDDQEMMVQALHEIRMEILEQPDVDVKMYVRATTWYERELERYQKMDQSYQAMRQDDELQTLKGLVAGHIQRQRPLSQPYIDVEAEPPQPGYTHVDAEQESLGSEPDRYELARQKVLAMIEDKKRVLPDSKRD